MATVPQDVQTFIDGALATVKLARPQYTEYDASGNLVAVYCRLCDAKIKGWVDFENMPDGKIRQRFQQLGNYVEVPFRLNDGSFMFVASCADCAPAMQSSLPEVRDAVMAVEMDAWARSINRQNLGQEFMDEYWNKMRGKRIDKVAR